MAVMANPGAFANGVVARSIPPPSRITLLSMDGSLKTHTLRQQK